MLIQVRTVTNPETFGLLYRNTAHDGVSPTEHICEVTHKQNVGRLKTIVIC